MLEKSVSYLSTIIVFIFGIGLIGFGLLVVLKRKYAEHFLGLFASTARSHYIEQILRLVVGLAIVMSSSAMRYSQVFLVFGGVIVITTIGLLMMPWRWHQNFARKVIPLTIRFLFIYALLAFILGMIIIYALL